MLCIRVFIVLAICVLCAVVCGADDLKQTLLILQARVDALFERRQQDYKLLEESLKTSLEKSTDTTLLKAEVQTLKRELETLRGYSGTSGNQQKNDHLTVQWLATSVSELRGELVELSAATNASQEIARTQALTSELMLVKGDVTALRKEMDQMRGKLQAGEAKIATLEQELTATKKKNQEVTTLCLQLEEKMQAVQADWNNISPGLNYMFQDKAFNEEIQVGKDYKDNNEHKYRHQRILRKHLEMLEYSNRNLNKNQSKLEHLVHRLEKQVKSLSYHRTDKNNFMDEEVLSRVNVLEQSDRKMAKALFNMSKQVAGLDRLHVSMLELLESVETIENKMDKTIPDLQREISKMEFNLAQTTSSIAEIKEDQSNQRSSVKAMSGGMSAMQNKIDNELIRIANLESLWKNMTGNMNLNHTMNGLPLNGLSVTADSKSNTLPTIVDRLSQIIKEYNSIVADLPQDCGDVSGPTGLYIIAPGGVNPIVTMCDQDTGAGGWTVVQKRFDGSQEFNKNWQQYADGFGVPNGEFWLGNEILHRMTKANLSSVRIDLVDIYGKAWYAEYDEFSISSKEDGYRLHVGAYHGNASDALEYQNHMQFSSIDSDRDVSNTHCAANYEGGWWFSHCQHANLNGRYNLGLTWFDSSRNEWIAVARSEMKVRNQSRSCIHNCN